MPASVSYLFVPVRDLHATHRFYVELLGLEVLAGRPERTSMRIGGGGFVIEFKAIPDAAVPTPGVEIVVRVDDVDAVYERLLARGVVFDAPPADQAWGARHAWTSDPTGYRVSIYSTKGSGTP